MITVIDTNILLDILSGLQPQARAARSALRIAGLQGSLILPMVCYAELSGNFKFQVDLDTFLASIPVELLALDQAAAFLAGVGATKCGFWRTSSSRHRRS